MLLTISTTLTDRTPATDLGYLLHKHPDRVQEFKQSFGTAIVFYPEATEDRCTAALLLDVDPIRLARSRAKNAPDFSLAQYVNDRPYAASSLLGVALADVFSTARGGRCRSHQDLADSAIPLEIEIPVLPCRGGPALAHRLFEPLGWETEAIPIPLDERFPSWGDSRYVRLKLTGAGPTRRCPQPAPRSAAGARRVEALLAGRRRGRQAAALGRHLAGDASGTDPDHASATWVGTER